MYMNEVFSCNFTFIFESVPELSLLENTFNAAALARLQRRVVLVHRAFAGLLRRAYAAIASALFCDSAAGVRACASDGRCRRRRRCCCRLLLIIAGGVFSVLLLFFACR